MLRLGQKCGAVGPKWEEELCPKQRPGGQQSSAYINRRLVRISTEVQPQVLKGQLLGMQDVLRRG